MHMPEMDGLALAREIRRHDARTSCRSCCSARSAGAQASATTSVRAQLAKPMQASQLFDTLLEVARPSSATRAARRRRPPKTARPGAIPLRILLAEDNVVNQKLALRLLQQMGYRADLASNGLEAIESVERQPYDVVLMDVQMPEMDGLDASRQICARWTPTTRPRIVAMTANAMQGDREMCLAAGMDDYLTKPIRVDELVEALSRVRPDRATSATLTGNGDCGADLDGARLRRAAGARRRRLRRRAGRHVPRGRAGAARDAARRPRARRRGASSAAPRTR